MHTRGLPHQSSKNKTTNDALTSHVAADSRLNADGSRHTHQHTHTFHTYLGGHARPIQQQRPRQLDLQHQDSSTTPHRAMTTARQLRLHITPAGCGRLPTPALAAAAAGAAGTRCSPARGPHPEMPDAGLPMPLPHPAPPPAAAKHSCTE